MSRYVIARKFTSFPAFFIVIIFLLSSCAQVVAPGGGARDTTPPKVLKYTPDSAQLGFNSHIIQLDFDEYIQLKDLSNQLIISPPLEKMPDIRVKNKTMVIDLNKIELKPNTTYSFNFGNSIQDINENNAIENFKYIFSTGNFIDSLSVAGKVENSFDHKTEKGILVMLYSDMRDSAVYNSQPDYFAKTNPDGSFKITNIRQGKYKIAALKDVNANYKYDGESESIGFIMDTIDPSLKQSIRIEMFKEPSKKVYLKKYIHDSYGKIVLIFNQGSDSLRVNNLTNDQKGVQEFLEFSKNKDTLTYWLKNYEKDSLRMQVSNGNKIIDTVEFKMIKREDALKSKKNPLKLKVVSSPNGNQGFDLGSELVLRFNNPLSQNNNLPVLAKKDTLLLSNLFFDFDVTEKEKIFLAKWDSTNKCEDPDFPGKLIICPTKNLIHDWKENTSYHILILPGAFTDIFGLLNDSIKIDFKTKETKFYGSLKLKTDVPALKEFSSEEGGKYIRGRYIVQLLDEKENVVRENFLKKSETITYEYLLPQKYILKIIYDENGNTKWDSGNYIQKIQPEKVLYNSELINIRSNWDLDLDWKITE
jgi:uncharacterized protein (DUF2141 family)